LFLEGGDKSSKGATVSCPLFPQRNKKTLKKVKKTLDKSKKVWYNKYVIKGTKTL
jgi:hypothetical protein